MKNWKNPPIMDEKTGNYWKILETTIDWIKYSDAKATGILSIFGLIVTVVYANIDDIRTVMVDSVAVGVLTILAGLSSMIAIFFAFRCISPRIVKNQSNSIMFFGDIVNGFNSAEEYKAKTHQILDSNVGLDNELAQQIFVNSQIAKKKFKDVGMAIRFFVTSILFLLFEILILIFLVD
jgi:hypothetical protein